MTKVGIAVVRVFAGEKCVGLVFGSEMVYEGLKGTLEALSSLTTAAEMLWIAEEALWNDLRIHARRRPTHLQ
jgi:hypothetical protein